MRLFISYAHDDRKVVQQLAGDLEKLGHDIWFDQELSGSEIWWERILDEIEKSEVFLFAVSPSATESSACRTEYHYARQLNKPLLPIMIRETELLEGLREIHVVDALKLNSRDTALALGRSLTHVQGLILQGKYPAPDNAPARPSFPFPKNPLTGIKERVRKLQEEEAPEEALLIIVAEIKRIGKSSAKTADEARNLLKQMQNNDYFTQWVKEEIKDALESLPQSRNRALLLLPFLLVVIIILAGLLLISQNNDNPELTTTDTTSPTSTTTLSPTVSPTPKPPTDTPSPTVSPTPKLATDTYTPTASPTDTASPTLTVTLNPLSLDVIMSELVAFPDEFAKCRGFIQGFIGSGEGQNTESGNVLMRTSAGREFDAWDALALEDAISVIAESTDTTGNRWYLSVRSAQEAGWVLGWVFSDLVFVNDNCVPSKFSDSTWDSITRTIETPCIAEFIRTTTHVNLFADTNPELFLLEVPASNEVAVIGQTRDNEDYDWFLIRTFLEQAGVQGWVAAPSVLLPDDCSIPIFER
jgi:TIR domain